MDFKRTSIAEAYDVLDLEHGASFEQVKSSYKQLALRTHPDKNPDNPDATAQFQAVSEAYNVLSKHFERGNRDHGSRPRGFGGSFGFSPRGSPFFSSRSSEDDDDYYDDDYSDDDFDDDERAAFFMFLFEQIFKGQSRRQAHSHFYGSHRHTHDSETPEQYQARVKRAREEQAAAAERRAREAAQRKARQEQDRENERIKAEQRQKEKVEAKKAQAEAARRKAETTVRKEQQRVQTLRSATFAAARAGDVAGVKKGVYENNVDAAGGEVKLGCEEHAKPPKDPKETLLHIAARNGDAELVEWLGGHGADMEERNSQGRTALHIALRHGYSNVVKHIFEAHPPKDSESKRIYSLTAPTCLLSLAVDSREPEVVWMILETKGLATSQEIGSAWTKISSADNEASNANRRKLNAADEEKFNDIRSLLMRYGGFTPPPTPKVEAKPDSQWKAEGNASNSVAKGGPSPIPDSPPKKNTPANQQTQKPKQKQKQKQKPRVATQQTVEQPQATPKQTPLQSRPPNRGLEQKMRGSGRRGRGRGKATV